MCVYFGLCIMLYSVILQLTYIHVMYIYNTVNVYICCVCVYKVERV